MIIEKRAINKKIEWITDDEGISFCKEILRFAKSADVIEKDNLLIRFKDSKKSLIESALQLLNAKKKIAFSIKRLPKMKFITYVCYGNIDDVEKRISSSTLISKSLIA